MKNIIVKFAVFFIATVFLSATASAQFVVKIRPAPPVVRVRPVSPGPRYLWINGEYAWRGNQYVYKEGYWAAPPPRRTRWVEGKWKQRPGGWVWVRGHWR